MYLTMAVNKPEIKQNITIPSVLYDFVPTDFIPNNHSFRYSLI